MNIENTCKSCSNEDICKYVEEFGKVLQNIEVVKSEAPCIFDIRTKCTEFKPKLSNIVVW